MSCWAGSSREIFGPVVRVATHNAARLGYRPDQHGLKVRYRRDHIADAADLGAAMAVIAAALSRHLVFVDESSEVTQMREVAVDEPGRR